MNTSDAFVKGMATILWGDAWANHVEEHHCCSISGQQIEEIMPEIPECAWRLAERLAGKYEQANGNLPSLFRKALLADGVTDDDAIDYHGTLAERFGECLAWQAMGAGVSWFDDHAEFPINRVSIENFDLMIHAEETCEEEN